MDKQIIYLFTHLLNFQVEQVLTDDGSDTHRRPFISTNRQAANQSSPFYTFYLYIGTCICTFFSTFAPKYN